MLLLVLLGVCRMQTLFWACAEAMDTLSAASFKLAETSFVVLTPIWIVAVSLLGLRRRRVKPVSSTSDEDTFRATTTLCCMAACKQHSGHKSGELITVVSAHHRREGTCALPCVLLRVLQRAVRACASVFVCAHTKSNETN